MAFFNELLKSKIETLLTVIHKTDGICIATGEKINEHNFSIEHFEPRSANDEKIFDVDNLFLCVGNYNRVMKDAPAESKAYKNAVFPANIKGNEPMENKLKTLVFIQDNIPVKYDQIKKKLETTVKHRWIFEMLVKIENSKEIKLEKLEREENELLKRLEEIKKAKANL